MDSWCDTIKRPVPVLLVEDDENDRLLMRLNAQQYHIELIEAESGERALEIMKSRPDIKTIILDYRLPGMDGIELLRCIGERLSHLKTVMLSGFIDTKAMQELNEIRLCPCIPKPLTLSSTIIGQLFNWCGVPRKPQPLTV